MKYDIKEYFSYHHYEVIKGKNKINKKCEEVEKLVPEIKKILVQNGAKRIIIFGSFVEKNFSISSDLDVAEEGIPDHLFFKTYSRLCDISGNIEIDLIDLKEAGGYFRKRIMEGEIIYNAKK